MGAPVTITVAYLERSNRGAMSPFVGKGVIPLTAPLTFLSQRAALRLQ